MIKPVLGALKDPVDVRDYKVSAYLKVTAAELPVRLDVSDIMMPVRNQENEGSCVSFGVAAMKEYQEKYTNRYLSPRFMTDRIQKDADSGAFPRDAYDVLLKEGICPEECQPYIPRAKSTPCFRSSTLAKENKIKAYARLTTVDDMKRYLYESGAFTASFQVTESWYTPTSGLIIPQGATVGGHHICVVGYDDTRQVIKFRNSWGPEWGQGGYGYLPYVSVQQYLMDAWSVVDVPDAEEENPDPEPIPIPPPMPPNPTPQEVGNLLTILINFILSLFRRK